jgi:hypothetical protein
MINAISMTAHQILCMGLSIAEKVKGAPFVLARP